MATWMKQTVLMVVLLLPVLMVLQVAQARPSDIHSSSSSEEMASFLDHANTPQRQSSAVDDVNDALTLLSLLMSLHRQRNRSSDVSPQPRNQLENDVRLRKRQRQCYWSVVTCY